MTATATTKRFIVKTLEEVREFFNVSRQTVANWRKRGMPQSRNGYDLAKIAQWRLREEIEPSRPTETKADAAAANLLWQARMRELKFRHLAGEFVRRDVVANEVSKLFNVIRQRLQAIPSELASGVAPDMRADFMVDMEHRIAMILTQLANCKPVPVQKEPAK